MGKKVFPDSDPGCFRSIVVLPAIALVLLKLFKPRR